MMADLRELAEASPATEAAAYAERCATLAATYGFDVSSSEKPFIFSDGFALIPIHGLLINRFSWSWGFVTGYNFLRNQVAAAMADDDVTAIIFDVNSPGGMVAGCSETADLIYAANAGQGGKTSIAVVDANCHSAAYFLASQCDHIAITPSGSCANIGVVMMHADVSKMLDDIGIKITFITAGAHKVDGNPYEPLSDEVRAEFQADIDATYDTFIAAVVRGRGMDDAAVRETEARAYGASDALALGLIDAIQNPSDAVEAYFNSCSDDADASDDASSDDPGAGDDPDDDKPDEQENAMLKPVPGAVKPAAASQTPAVEVTSVDADAVAAEARTAERTRISGIQGHAEAVGRESLAAHLALHTDMSVEAAGGILAASPKAVAPVAAAAVDPKATPAATETNHFKAAMDNGKQPNVGANADGGDDENVPPAKRILALQARAMGYKPTTTH